MARLDKAHVGLKILFCGYVGYFGGDVLGAGVFGYCFVVFFPQ